MRLRHFTPLDFGIMIVLIGILSSVLLITNSSPQERIVRKKRLTSQEKRAIRGAEIAGLAYNNHLVQDETCQLRGIDSILVPRVSGTLGNIKVRDYLVKRIEALGWKSELDTFSQKTIIGDVTFSNVIGYSNPTAEKHVVFTAHFDSKLYPKTDSGKEFLGATDSAVPCAMILSIMDNLNVQLMKQQKQDPSRGIIVVFFDGEEAFKEWTATDSIYGSRHLAEKWKSEGFFDKMELFVLLDLIGAKDPTFTSSMEQTRHHFTRFVGLENELSGLGLLNKKQRNYFKDKSSFWGVEDDHKPFEKKGYGDIVHIISTPFPPQWHKMSDDGEHLDCETIHELQMVIQLWTAEMFTLHKLINM